MKIKAEEIIWEITNQCNKTCKYCGSKYIIEPYKGYDNSDDETCNIILNELCEYKPNSVTVSGGEPGCVSDRVITCAQRLKEAGVKEVKVITNGYQIDRFISCKNIDAIGLSINTIEDIECIEDKMQKFLTADINCSSDLFDQSNLGFNGKVTIVSNFGRHNLYFFIKLFDFIKRYNCFWQIQLTEGEFQLSKDEIEHLYNLIKTYVLPENNIGYVLADNVQLEHDCSAGVKSCGITYDGYVISCLSKRSWKSIDNALAFNLTETSFKTIWENSFSEERFGCPTCCRTNIEYPDLPLDFIPVLKYRNTPVVTTTKAWEWDKVTPQKDPLVILYGIWPQPNYPDKDDSGKKPYDTGHVYVYSAVDPFKYTFTSTPN